MNQGDSRTRVDDEARARARERLARRQAWSSASGQARASVPRQAHSRPSAANDDLALRPYRVENYSLRSSSRVRPRNKMPFVLGGIAALAVIVCVVLVVSGLFSNESRSDDSNGTAQPASPLEVLVPSDNEASVSADDVVMTLGGDSDTYVLVGEEYLEAGCHAVDPEQGDITSTVEVSGSVDTSKAGDYTITYTAHTSDGGRAVAERTVHVVDSFESFDGNATSLPVLMHHYVYTESDAPADLNGNYLLDTKLDAQLQYLSDNDYYYPSFQEVKAYTEGTHTLPARSVVLTFDDCETGFLKYGVPLLEKHQVPATSFVICSDDDASQKIYDNASPYVSYQSHSYAMHQAGSNVGRGGRIHAMTQEEIADDLRQAQAILGTTEAFAYPFGDNNELAQAALRDTGVLCAFTIVNDRIYVGDDPTVLSRVRISGEYTQESFEYLVAPNAA